MRYISPFIENDLREKMVLITGPRQCGKTTLALELIKKDKGLYLNWDDPDNRKTIYERKWSDNEKLICFDEIHKFSKWKNFVKGTYDTQKNKHKFIITGSARLDLYKKGQDSMVGRFFSWRLHPLCLSELKSVFKREGIHNIYSLLDYGGFPEPFFKSDLTYSKRWRRERALLIFRQDIQEIERVKDISLLEFFYEALKERVSGEVVLSNIARDIEIAPKTAKAWLSILERTYSLFVVPPYSRSLTKAIVKTPKVYFYDNGEVAGDKGAKFENLVATHLLKRIHFLEDLTGDKYELNYIRDKNGHEIDFVIIKNRKPVALIEAKVTDNKIGQSFYYFKEKLKISNCVQLVLELDKSFTKDGISVINAYDWLSEPLEKEIF